MKKLLGPINAKIHGLFQYLQSTVDPTLSFQILKVWSASVVGTRMPQMNGVRVVVLLFLTGSVMCITGFARAFYQRPVTYRRFSLSSAPLPASLNGVIAIYKPPSYTSADVVNIVKGVLKLGCSKSGSKSSLPKVGHGGTLDPMAEGVLVIGIGAGTKMLQSFLNGSKTYIAVAALGTETNTLDRMGEIVKRLPFDHVDQTLIENTLPAYTGNITQIPPMFSALKSNGKRLYDLARKGIVVERKPREVSVYHLQLLSPNDMVGIFSEFPSTANPPCSLPHDFALRIVCSGGFYVRSLIDDIGKHMQTCAHMTYLQRSQQGPFTVKDCLKLSDLTYRNVVDNLNHCSTVATGGYSPMESKNLLLESIEIR